MIWVRFPNGQTVRYNDAVRVEYGDNGRTKLLNEEGRIVSIVLTGTPCLVEFMRPCSVENATALLTFEAALDLVLARMQEPGPSWAVARKLGELKRKLRSFNTRRGSWS